MTSGLVQTPSLPLVWLVSLLPQKPLPSQSAVEAGGNFLTHKHDQSILWFNFFSVTPPGHRSVSLANHQESSWASTCLLTSLATSLATFPLLSSPKGIHLSPFSVLRPPLLTHQNLSILSSGSLPWLHQVSASWTSCASLTHPYGLFSFLSLFPIRL